MAASRLIREWLKSDTRVLINPVTGQVGTTVTQVLRGNPDRLLWIFVNLGANDVYLGFDQDVSPTRGILVASGGGAARAWWREDGELVIHPVYAIASTAAADVYVVVVEATD